MPMISFEWLELETLSREIANLEDRLRQAKSTNNHGLMRIVEQQLDETKARRPRILDEITRKMASTAADAPPPIPKPKKAKAAAAARVADAQPAVTTAASTEAKDDTAKPKDDTADDRAAPAALPSANPMANPMEGDSIMWEQLTPDHLERAKRELARRRADILARHADELKELEADQDEIDALDRAIGAFARKFNAPAENGAEVVELEEERGLRMAVPA